MRENAGDKWALEVLGRVKDCSDFVAAERRYHVNCYVYFQTDPKRWKSHKLVQSLTQMMENFQWACDRLESEIVLRPVKETQGKMKEQINGQAVYGVQYIKSSLTNRYQDHIYFCNESERENIVYFKEMTDYLINEKYRQRKTTVQEWPRRIQALAAILIKAEISERKFNKGTHPSAVDIANLNRSPPLIHHFLKGLINTKLKQESLATVLLKQ